MEIGGIIKFLQLLIIYTYVEIIQISVCLEYLLQYSICSES